MEILRDYQLKSVESLRDVLRSGKRRPILVSPTGSGKSVTLGNVISLVNGNGKNVLWLVHRRNLTFQMRDTLKKFFGIDVGIIMAGVETDLENNVQLCTYQTFSRRMNLGYFNKNKVLIDPDIIIVDECFAGDTLISTPMGEKRIDIMRCGDIVYNQFGVGVVKSIFSTMAKTDLYLLEIENGKTIKCTGDHPVFTKDGWKEVRKLDKGEDLFSIKGMSLLWKSVLPSEKGEYFFKNRKTNQENSIRMCMEKAEILLDILCKEDGKSYERQSGSPAHEGYIEKDKTSSYKKRGERAVATFATISNSSCFRGRLGIRGECTNQKRERIWLSDLLQDRCSQSRENDRDRNRREFSCYDCKEKGRCEKDRISHFPRVVNISNIQRKGITPVFNLRVSGHPSYFANGIAVHNCHRSISKSYQDILERYKDKITIGTTATPMRFDGRGMGEVYDSIVDVTSVKELTDKGYLVPVRYFVPSQVDLEGVRTSMGDYMVKDLEGKMVKTKLIGDIVENWLKLAENRKTIVYAVNVKHSKAICEAFMSQGVDAEHLDARSSDDERDAVFENVQNGRTTVVCNVALYTEGLDIPSVSAIVIARPTKSMGLYRQMAGRGLRPAKGKNDVILLDHGNVIETHGLLDWEIEWSLDGKKKAWNKPKREKTEKLVKCRACHQVFMGSNVCPDCGTKVKSFGKKIMTVEAELEEIEGKQKFSMAEKRQWYGMFKWQARSKGYQDGWVSHKFKEKFGVWPNSLKDTAAIEPNDEFRNWMKYQIIKWVKRKKKEEAKEKLQRGGELAESYRLQSS